MVEISRGLILLCFYGCWNPFRILIVARSHGAVKNFWARMTIAFAGFASDNDGAKRHQNSAACTCQQKLDTKLKKLGIKIEYLYKIQ